MRCTNTAGHYRPEGSLCSHNGYLLVPNLSAATAERIRAAASTAGLDIDVARTSIEFQFEGRDSNQFVVDFLRQLAGDVGTAEGEIRCEITGEGDSIFEFFKMRDSRLFPQRATLVREIEEDLGNGSSTFDCGPKT